ncbi:FecR family protein [uncultured Draconibacterium sp.]|uniref:FecR family protein n=1 Tax=uncultured Draconibacterium sp. TaxID=1573823 RepID=UPI0029C7DDBB|nr:FecR family protein [uncultured Draconibacterium sp.]
MIEQSDKEKLDNYRKGFSNAKEEEYIYSLFSKNEDNVVFKNHVQKEYNNYMETHVNENHDLSYLLDHIHHIIHKKEHNQKETVVKRIYRWYNLAAAILLIPILLFGGIWLSKQNQIDSVAEGHLATSTIHAPLGSRISFSLPDGTNGWLNSGSSIKYANPFTHNRSVEISGEAWFNIAHDADFPFEVTCGESKVKVLGTKFNFYAYPEEEFVEVVLEEGKVEFSTLGLSSNVQMAPSERLVLNEGTINISTTDVSKYSAWREGKLVFRGDTMHEVARRIGRWYNVDVEVVDEGLEDYTFRGTFQDDSLEEVLNYISMTSPINYRIINRKTLDDGTVQKKRILLFKK